MKLLHSSQISARKNCLQMSVCYPPGVHVPDSKSQNFTKVFAKNMLYKSKLIKIHYQELFLLGYEYTPKRHWYFCKYLQLPHTLLLRYLYMSNYTLKKKRRKRKEIERESEEGG